MKQPAVYLMADRYRGAIYIGVTSGLWQRVWDHKNGRLPGFTSRYGLKRLVWYEHRHTMERAIAREKQLKGLAPRMENRVDRADESGLA
jgi:putative endonuclease